MPTIAQQQAAHEYRMRTETPAWATSLVVRGAEAAHQIALIDIELARPDWTKGDNPRGADARLLWERAAHAETLAHVEAQLLGVTIPALPERIAA